jgi:hypothetical protein
VHLFVDIDDLSGTARKPDGVHLSDLGCGVVATRAAARIKDLNLPTFTA